MQKTGVSSLYRALLFAALGISTVLWFGTARADAMAELCPASLQRMEPSIGGRYEASPAFTYELQAITKRTIDDATVIADTDHGWYRWTVADIALPMTAEIVSGRLVKYTEKFAQSARLEVVFPEPLLVYHAWVLSAKSGDETTLGWAARGEVTCQVPAFEGRLPNKAAAAQAPAPIPSGSPTPPPTLGTPAKAIAAVTPFDTVECAVPFKKPTVTYAQAPDYPDSARESTINAGVVYVEVALDEEGRLLDASIYAGSGNSALDLSGLRAARKSTYSGAVSYCEKVRGQFLFTATFFAR
jgi:TonB family protein